MIDKKKLADALGVSVPTIERHMRIGMPYYKLPNGTVRFELEEVKSWMREKKGE